MSAVLLDLLCLTVLSAYWWDAIGLEAACLWWAGIFTLDVVGFEVHGQHLLAGAFCFLTVVMLVLAGRAGRATHNTPDPDDDGPDDDRPFGDPDDYELVND